jgi:hypothetical protein
MLTLGKEGAKILANGHSVRRWRRLVRIAYFDEAGRADEKREPYFVVGGVLIHGDLEWQPIEYVARCIVDLVPVEIRDGFHISARRLYSGDKCFKGLLDRGQRMAILRAVVTQIIEKYKLPICYGAIRRSDLTARYPDLKDSIRLSVAHQAAFDLCLRGFQNWFMREHPDEMAIAVADKVEERKLPSALKRLFATLRTHGLGDPFFILSNFVDALHFAFLSESIGLQLADVVSFIIRRHLMQETDTEELYKILEPLLVCEPSSALWPITSEA